MCSAPFAATQLNNVERWPEFHAQQRARLFGASAAPSPAPAPRTPSPTQPSPHPLAPPPAAAAGSRPPGVPALQLSALPGSAAPSPSPAAAGAPPPRASRTSFSGEPASLLASSSQLPAPGCATAVPLEGWAGVLRIMDATRHAMLYEQWVRLRCGADSWQLAVGVLRVVATAFRGIRCPLSPARSSLAVQDLPAHTRPSLGPTKFTAGRS